MDAWRHRQHPDLPHRSDGLLDRMSRYGHRQLHDCDHPKAAAAPEHLGEKRGQFPGVSVLRCGGLTGHRVPHDDGLFFLVHHGDGLHQRPRRRNLQICRRPSRGGQSRPDLRNRVGAARPHASVLVRGCRHREFLRAAGNHRLEPRRVDLRAHWFADHGAAAQPDGGRHQPDGGARQLRQCAHRPGSGQRARSANVPHAECEHRRLRLYDGHHRHRRRGPRQGLPRNEFHGESRRCDRSHQCPVCLPAAIHRWWQADGRVPAGECPGDLPGGPLARGCDRFRGLQPDAGTVPHLPRETDGRNRGD